MLERLFRYSYGLTVVFYGSALQAHDQEAQLPFDRPHAHEELEVHAHLGWESRYFSEGRDALDGDSLIAGSFELGWKHLAAGVWYGTSPDQEYDELQLTLALTQTFGDFEVYGGYTHLRTPFDGAYDDEIGAGISWSGLPMDWELAADIYYSFDADGYFAELGASREFEITEELSLGFSGVFGMNQGYVSDGHDGANHFALGIGLEYALNECLSLAAHASYSWALDRDRDLPGDELLTDFFHGGVGLEWSF